ncbi:hypothetical protein PGC35_14125 [Psychrobacillus sp. PGGUH221]|uniref:hypothetical protein n=1 Tax=Psychrobacillus sp. PGGUH221 TaxID=3020058 RepID=UPI0035C73B10
MESNIIDFLKDKGVKNPENPKVDDMIKIFEILSEGKDEFNKDIFKEYSKTVNPSVQSVIDGMKSFAKEHVSKEYINSINKVIDQLNKEYEKAKTEEEKDKIYDQIERLLDRIKAEAHEQREWIKTLGKYGLGGAVILGGIGIAIATRNTEVLKKGLQVLNDNKNLIK